MCINNLPRIALDSGEAGIRTHNLLIARTASQPLGHTSFRMSMKYISGLGNGESTDTNTKSIKYNKLSTAFVLNYQEDFVSLSSQSLGQQTRTGEGQVGHLAWTYHSEGPIRSIPSRRGKGELLGLW